MPTKNFIMWLEMQTYHNCKRRLTKYKQMCAEICSPVSVSLTEMVPSSKILITRKTGFSPAGQEHIKHNTHKQQPFSEVDIQMTDSENDQQHNHLDPTDETKTIDCLTTPPPGPEMMQGHRPHTFLRDQTLRDSLNRYLLPWQRTRQRDGWITLTPRPPDSPSKTGSL